MTWWLLLDWSCSRAIQVRAGTLILDYESMEKCARDAGRDARERLGHPMVVEQNDCNDLPSLNAYSRK